MSWQPPQGPPQEPGAWQQPPPPGGTPGQGQWQRPPAPWPQQSPPRKRNKLVIVLVVIVFIIVAAGGTCAYLLGRTLGAGSRPYFDAGNDYLAALERGDADAAYALLCPEVTEAVPAAAFERAMGEVARPEAYNLTSFFVTSTNGVTRREVSGTVDVAANQDVPVVLHFNGDEPLVCDAETEDPNAHAAVWPAGVVPR